MADANTSSTQQASDAQHVDNMTSMQQSTPDAPSGARSDAPVQTNNVGSQDGPSQLNSNPNGNSANNNNLGGGLQNSAINGGFSGNLGTSPGPRGGDAGGALNGLAGNGGNVGGAQGQGGAGNTGVNNLGGNNGGAAGGAGIVAAGARSLAAFGGAGAGNAANVGAANGAPTGGGEGGPPPANTNAPSNGTNTTIPVTTTTTAGPTFTPVGADDASNSSGQPQVHLGNTGNLIEAGGVNNAIAGTPSVSDTLISSTGSAFTVVTNATASTSGYGTYTMDADGTWHYTLNNSNITVQALNVGGSLTDTFTVSTIDGTQQVVTVTIAGANDIPVIGGISTGAVKEDVSVNNLNHTINANGLLTITDVDLGQSAFTPQTSVAASYGTFTLTTDGHWTYSADNTQTAIQQLGAGQSVTDSFTAVSADGTNSQLVTVTINGTNDVPVISNSVIDSVDHGKSNYYDGDHSGLVVDGSLSIQDADIGQNSFVAGTFYAATGNGDTLSLTSDGHYKYTIDNVAIDVNGIAVDAGGSGIDNYVLDHFQTLFPTNGGVADRIDTFNITAFDGTTQTVNLNIYGEHNVIGQVYAPDGSPSYTSSVTLSGSLDKGIFATSSQFAVISGTLAANGSNDANPHNYNLGSLTIDPLGHYTYTLNPDAVANFTSGGTFNFERDTFLVSSTDSSNNINIQEVSFNIFEPGHVTLATNLNGTDSNSDNTLVEAALDGSGNNVFLFDTWNSIYSDTGAHNHTISGFNEYEGDRIDLSAILTSPSDILSSVVSINGADGSSNSTLSVHHDGSDYQVATVTGVEATVNDLLWGPSTGISQVTALNAATTWIDVVDISNISSEVGNPTITTHDGATVDTTAYAGGAGWTIDIVSGNATVSADKDGTQHINFTSPNSQNEVIITDPSNKVHDLSNINQINWHAT